MKLLCVADQIDPLVYSNSIKARFRDADIVLSAGDLPMEYLGFIASSLNKPVVFVFGNHHLKNIDVFKKGYNLPGSQGFVSAANVNMFGSTWVGGKSVHVKGLIIVGLGGSMWYNGGPNQFSDLQMYFKVFRLLPRLLLNKLMHGRYLDIFLTHSPPRGIGDRPDRCHTGFEAFLWFLRVFKPRYMIHGHIHLYDMNAVRNIQYHETTIVNVFNHYVLDFEE